MAKTKKTEEVIDTMLKKERMAGDIERQYTGKYTAKVGPESMDIKLIPNPMPQTPERIAKARELSKAERMRVAALGKEAYPKEEAPKMASPGVAAKAMAKEKVEPVAMKEEKKRLRQKD